jgi:hypothetical protein
MLRPECSSEARCVKESIIFWSHILHEDVAGHLNRYIARIMSSQACGQPPLGERRAVGWQDNITPKILTKKVSG